MDRFQREGMKNVIWGGLIGCATGLFIIAMAIWGDGSGFYAPRWVIGAAGGTFLLAGLAIFGQDIPLFSGLVRALLLTCFGAVFTWASFGSGERQFSSTVSIPFFSFSRSSPGILGRICFAPGAILLDAWALYSWFKLGQDWVIRDHQE